MKIILEKLNESQTSRLSFGGTESWQLLVNGVVFGCYRTEAEALDFVARLRALEADSVERAVATIDTAAATKIFQ